MLKNRLNCKWLWTLILIGSVCASALAGLRAETWSVNPYDFRYDMSLYFNLVTTEYENLDLYEVGAFCGEECRGLAENLELPGDENCLYMRIRSNSIQGEAITFRMRNKLTGEITTLKNKDNESFTFKADQMVGLPSDLYLLTPYYQVTIQASDNGSVTFENGLYPEGSLLSITAVPDTGYHFDIWSDGDTEATRQISVNGNIELSASFAVNIHTATFIIDGETIATVDIPFGAIVETPPTPDRYGHTFSGWVNVPKTMPDNDIEITGFYTVNTYRAVFKIDGQLFADLSFEFGAPIVAPEVPKEDGRTFNGWTDVPETMPAHDIEISGSYTVNTYKAIFKVEDTVIAAIDVEFGATITAPDAPEKEGHTFDGWADVPETMPAHDIEVSGSYTVNTYKAIFKVEDTVIAAIDVEFGATITTPDAPEKEGHTFNGWADVPETMPAHDIEISGSYIVNTYKAVFKVEDNVIATIDVEFGATITAPDAPEKEGHTFNGWADVPETMPAHDIEISGSYAVNTYRLIVYINDDTYMDFELEFGAEIFIPDPELPSTMEFNGWDTEIPATMPAHDVEIHGIATEKVSSALSVIFDEDSLLTICNMRGVLFYKNVKAEDIRDRLTAGIYIINGKKILIK